MLILGLDPGLAKTGWGLVQVAGSKASLVEYGCIRTKPDTDHPERLLQLYRQLSDLLLRYQPEAAAVEQLFFNRNVSSAFAVGQARGVAILCLAQQVLPVHEYTPLQIKLALTGNGRAEKEQVGFMVRQILQLREAPQPADAADAVAAALCHGYVAHSRLTGLRKEG